MGYLDFLDLVLSEELAVARKVRPRQLVEIRATKSQVMLHSTTPAKDGD